MENGFFVKNGFQILDKVVFVVLAKRFLKEGFVDVLGVLGNRFWVMGRGLWLWHWFWSLGVRKYFVVLEIVFWGVVVTATGYPITNAYMIGQVFTSFFINITSELMRFVACRTGVPAVFSVVFF